PLEQLPRDLGVLLDERPELPGGEAVRRHRRLRGHGRGTGAVVDQSDLAEVVAGAASPDVGAADAVAHRALADDEEADAALPLRGDHLAGAAPALAIGHLSEQVDPAEQLERNRHRRPSLPRWARRVDPLRELLDLALGGLELRRAESVELLAALPELERLVERGVAALQPFHDAAQLLLCLFVGHSTRAPNDPSATSIAIASPGATAAAERTSSSPRRTIAYPRSRVARGERARSRPPAWVSAARRRSTSSAGARRRRSCRCASRCACRSTVARAPRPSPIRARASPARSSSRSGTTSRPAAVGVDARTSAARSHSGVSCSCPTAVTTGTGQPATARTRRSSLNGSRSSKLPPPRARTTTSTSGAAQTAPSAATISRAARGPCTYVSATSTRAAGKRDSIAVST